MPFCSREVLDEYRLNGQASDATIPAQHPGPLSCCRFRGHEDKIVTKESEIGNETEVYERVQV